MKKFITILAFIFVASQALAQEKAEEKAKEKEFLVQIKDHKFEPAIIEVDAGQKFKLIIENLDKTLEEFESNDLKKEKLISGEKKAVIIVGPLKSGEYKFFGDFHQKTAQGKILVK
jgi:plastocyanin